MKPIMLFACLLLATAPAFAQPAGTAPPVTPDQTTTQTPPPAQDSRNGADAGKGQIASAAPGTPSPPDQPSEQK